MKKTEHIPIITNLSIEPFLSRELSALSDGAGVLLEPVPIPYMEYREHGGIYGKAGMVFIWLDLEGMLPGWDDGGGGSRRDAPPSWSGRTRSCAATFPASHRQSSS